MTRPGEVEMVPTLINERWELLLPKHRAVRPEWPYWEKERIGSMYEHLEEGDIIFDVGAEEGDMPGLWASWGCEVVCFEPNPKVWPNIRVIWEANGFPPLKDWWVGFAGDFTNKYPPEADVDQSEKDGWPVSAWGRVIGDHGFRHLAQQADATPTISIDRWCQENGYYPDAITMDVEGSELRVLAGAHDTLLNHHPKVWVSVHTDEKWMEKEYDGVNRQDVLDYMDKFGYEATHLATDHEEHWMFL